MSFPEERNNNKTTHRHRTHDNSAIQSTTLTPLDRYTALRNHRIRFQDAMDPNAERVTSLRNQDVIFGRGKNMQDYPGNRRMRSIINKYKERYHSIERSRKRDLIETVYKEIVRGGSRFLTKATNNNYFFVVDIEVALQKVGNTLRCRKKWREIEKSVNSNGENVGSNECTVSQSKVPVMTTTSLQETTTRPQATDSSHATNRLPLVSAAMLSRRRQIMSFLRENTLRLIQQLPLRPATADGVLYLQQCKVSSVHSHQLTSQPVANILVKDGAPSYPPRTILQSACTSVSDGGDDIANIGTCGHSENGGERVSE